MTDSASEADLESDACSMDGHNGRCDQLQRQVDLLLQENRMFKTEVEQLNLRVKGLMEKNNQLRRNSVSIQAQAEREEEYISNTLQRQISELKKDKETLVVKYEEEEERLINELNRKLTRLQKDKERLEKTLVKEQDAQVNKLKHRIKRLESESEWKQKVFDKLRRDKVELENALEQEQEAFVNRLWKKMAILEEEKRQLQNKLENACAPVSGTLNIQNVTLASAVGQPQNVITTSTGFQQAIQNHNSANSSFRGSQHIPNTSVSGGTILDNSEFAGCLSNNQGLSPSASCIQGSFPTTNTQVFIPRPPPSPMDLDYADSGSSAINHSRSDISLHSGGFHRNSSQRSSTSDSPVLIEGTAFGSTYVTKLRDEVIRLRAIVAANQTEQFNNAEQERSAMDENARLRHLLLVEVERKDALSRNFSGSESSLEMDEERILVDGNCIAFAPNRLRTTSDGLSAPFHNLGPYSGAGRAFFSTANTANASVRSASPAYCRECGQSLSASKVWSGPITPPPSSSGSFARPLPRIRPPNPIRQPANFKITLGQSSATLDTNLGDEDEDDERSKTPPGSLTN